MIIYDFGYINNIIKNMKTSNSLILDEETKDYLNILLNTIKKNNKKISYNNNNNNNNNYNNNNNKNYNRQKSNNRDFKKKDNTDPIKEEILHNISRTKIHNNKTDIEIHNNNIRKLLNKISNNNFEKISNEFICYYKTLLNYKDIEDINKFIFSNLTFNNSCYSKLYCELYCKLLNINEKFIDLLNNNINYFLHVYEKLYLKDDTDIETINKNNDKYICLILFYINCFKLKLLPDDFLYNTILNLQNYLNDNLKKDNNLFLCEVITNFIFIIISNSHEILIEKTYADIFNNIKYINNMKNKDLPSLNNKILFKHRDIFEKFKPLN